MNDIKVDFSAIRYCVNGNMRMFSRTLTQYYDSKLAPAGIIFTQLMVLAVIANMEEAPIQMLARALMMDRTTLTRALKPLERDNLVAINPAKDDQRKRLVRLTDEGIVVLEEAHPLWQEAQTSVENLLGSERWRQMYDDMHTMLSELDKQNDS